MNVFSVSANCLNIITSSESLQLGVYLCPANVLTIGWGHKLLAKFDAQVFGMAPDTLALHIKECQARRRVTAEAKQMLKITRYEALAFLGHDVGIEADFINSVVQVPLNQNQFDALVSLSFNIGQGNFASSTLREKLAAGDYAGAAQQFDRWNKATVKGVKKIEPGLVTRRAAERALFEKPL